jgi:hypothetical protein
MKIIIYATHSYGTYETLKQHPDVIVLGFGTKWKGFIQKAITIYDYLNTLPENEIVVILDGFDSYIKKTQGIHQEFVNMDCKVLVSLHKSSFPKIIDDYVSKRVFDNCKENHIANSGLCMGYARYLKEMWREIIKGPSNDDQRNLNLSCRKLPFLKIDTQNIIFQNCANMEEVNNSTAYFCQKPGTMTVSRWVRGVQEYYEYFIPEIVGMILILSIFAKRKSIIKFLKNLNKS